MQDAKDHPWAALIGTTVAIEDWKKHPWSALTETVLNVGPMVVAGPEVAGVKGGGEASRLAHEVSTIGKVTDRADELARLARIDTEAGRRLVPTVHGLKALDESKNLDTSLRKALDAADVDVRVSDHAVHLDRVDAPDSEAPHPRTVEPGGPDHPDAGTKPDAASDGQHHVFDVNSSTVDPVHHVVHDGEEFTLKPIMGPSLADARISLRTNHLDALHHRDALARAEGVDPKDLTVKNERATLRELQERAVTPADLRRQQELADATRREYLTNLSLHKMSERMGTEAGKEFRESRGETLIVGDHDLPGGKNRLDTVGINDSRTVLDVVEEKGATSKLGTAKLDSGVRVEQGSSAYLNKMLHTDPEIREHFRRNPGDVQRLIDRDMELRYHVVRARIDGTVWVERMKLNPDELHLDDLLPSAPVAGPAVPTPVPQPR